MRKTARILLPVLGAVLLSPLARASPLLDVVGGMDGQGGLQARTVAGGGSAAYFNPALLADAPAGLTIGVVMMSQQIGVSLDGRPGAEFNVPDDVANASRADGSRWDQYPIPTSILDNGRAADALRPALGARPRQGNGSGHEVLSYEMVGAVGKLFQKRLSLGFFALVPNGDFTTLRAHYADEREQYFSNSLHPELYGDRLSALSLAGGAAYKISDQLSIGIAATLSLRAGVAAQAFVADAGRLEDILISSDAKVNVSVSPHVGVAYAPTERWRVTGTVHSPEKVELGSEFKFLLATGIEQTSSVTWVYDYMPWQIGLGTSYDVVKTTEDTLSAAATAVYGRWSDYIDRQGERPLAAYEWRDTVTGTAGLRYRHGKVSSLLDFQFKPTPVPPQTGRTNYVDNDRAGAHIGAGYEFELFGSALHFGAQFQTYWLLPRRQTKLPTPTFSDGENRTPALVMDEVPDDAQLVDEPVSGREGLQTNNPGWPGFGSEGWIVAGGVYLSVGM